jgi:hypothetical protein
VTATVHALPTGHAPDVVLVDAAELAALRETARLAALLCTTIHNRRAKGWHRAPMRLVNALTAALLKGTS